MALEAAGTASDLAGLILVAVPGRPLGAVLREQLAANPANAGLMPEALDILNHLERGERVEAMSPVLLPLFRPAVQGFLISLLRVDPAAMIAGTRRPVLILQGGARHPGRRGRCGGLAPGEPGVPPGAGGAGQPRPQARRLDDRAANIAAYRDPGLPLAAGVIEAITAMVTDKPAAP